MGDTLGLVVVVLAAAAAAGIVYRLAVRHGTGTEGWSLREPPRSDPVASDPQATGGGAYLPVVTSVPSMRDRVTGLVGLIVMVSFGGIALAFALYAGGSMLAHLIAHVAHSGG
jgi:hypothetical protein